MEMVRDFGRIRLSLAAEQLAVSVSTAHRLMAMLVYRGYAEQDASRRYVPGPAMGLPPTRMPWAAQLQRAAWPHLTALAQRTGETANLMVLSGVDIRFLASVESEHPLRIGDRQGVVLPARYASGGKALLATLEPADLEHRFRRHASTTGRRFDSRSFQQLSAELSVVRGRGFAANFEGTEEGISAVGVAVGDGAETVGALSVSVPQHRFREVIDRGLIEAVIRTREEFEVVLRHS